MVKNNRLKILLLILLLLGALSGCTETQSEEKKEYSTQVYREKIEAVKESMITDVILSELGKNPAGEAGHVVFISVCDKKERAKVFSGSGETLETAWENADKTAEAFLKENDVSAQWVKADIVYVSEKIQMEELKQAVYASRSEFFRYGVSLDENYENAFLEAELNGAKILEYDNGGIDLNYLNLYLKKTGKEELKTLPEECIVFQCIGSICDEKSEVYDLYNNGLEYGRRKVEHVDAEYTEEIIGTAIDFLTAQLKEDGSFIYGMYPRFDNEIENYNIVRHAAAIWSLVCRYRMTGEEELLTEIESAIGYMLENIVYLDDETAYLYEEKDDEIKLGGCGLALISMTEYMNASGKKNYTEVCEKLGNGILTMLDQTNGHFYHVLNGDFTKKEEFRTVYYDGEATFGLCQLYELTGEQKWLDAAIIAVENFIRSDYWQYKDHWIAYSMNAITKYIDDSRYYDFALENAQRNLEAIHDRDTTYHTYLELLMATFEVYDRMIEKGIYTEYLTQFDLAYFLETIEVRANRMLNGYFYPEYAMYMENPQRVLGTFMVRHDGYRIRIDDVQHNVGAYYLYYKNYEKLIAYGMLK